MAKFKKKSLGAVNFVKKVAAHRSHPVVGMLLQYVAPAVGGYATVQVVGRIARGVVGKRWPGYAAHAAIGAKLATAATLYYATGAVQSLKKHREAILAGAGIALFETLVKALLPGMGWLIDAPAAQSAITDGEVYKGDATDPEGEVDFEGATVHSGANVPDGTEYGPDGQPLADLEWGQGLFDLN